MENVVKSSIGEKQNRRVWGFLSDVEIKRLI